MKRSLIKGMTYNRWMRVGLFVYDAVAVNLAYYLALVVRFYINFEFLDTAASYIPAFFQFIPYYTVFSLIVFYAMRLYSSEWEYASAEDMNRILIASVITTAGHVLGTVLITKRMPLSYYGIGAVIQFFLIAGSRFFSRIAVIEVRSIRARRKLSGEQKNTMVVGVSETAHQVLRHMKSDVESSILPVCVVDYRSDSYITVMEGFPVVKGVEDIPDAVRKYNVERVILADPSMPGAIRKRVRELCLDLEVQDYIGYFQESWNSITPSKLIEYTTSEVELVINGVHRLCSNGKEAAQYITPDHAIKRMYAQGNRLVVELQVALTLMYITNNPAVAQIAEKNGVQRVWIDLETLGKEERQKNMNTVKSHHSIEDIAILSNVLTTSDLLVRVNPINKGSKKEIDAVIAAGADMIMLPMWKSVEDVKKFLGYVDGRVKTTLLLETKEAAECIDDVLEMGGFDEIHIGLNDLHLSYGLTFMFELLANGTVETLCKKIAAKGIPYGFGGIARIGEGALPAERIVEEHYRLSSTRAILSRSFCNAEEIKDVKKIEVIFAENMARLRDVEQGFLTATDEELEENRQAVVRCVEEIVKKKRLYLQKQNR